jgi:hypothetical protein
MSPMTHSPTAKTQRIRLLNDDFRRTFIGGTVMITPGIENLQTAVRGDLFRRVREFSAFDCEDDPYGEHDFGAITVGVHSFFWKIDYYDRDLKHGSDDPADPAKTTRVLTIMLVSEY